MVKRKRRHEAARKKGGSNISITVIDAPCGAGKTTWAIQTIVHNPEKSYVYCTPFLDEIERIRKECGKLRFKEPLPYNGTKIDDFNELLAAGESIAVSHVTFLNATPETLERIHEGQYTLILDEVLDVICEFNKISSVEESPRQSMTQKDIQTLLEKGMIEVGQDFRVTWCDREHDRESKFYEVMRLAKLGRLYLARDKLLVTIFPPEMFRQYEDVYVLTYMFGGSMLKSYFDLFGLSFDKASIIESDTGKRQLIPYDDSADTAFRRQCRSMINIYDSPKLNRNGRTLSKSWYDSANADAVKRLKNDVGEYFNRVLKDAKASNGDIMWTCPVTFMEKISGKGYTRARSMTVEEKKLPEHERKKLENKLNCFVSCNAKATNVYGDRWALAYCCNMFAHPLVRGLLEDCGIKFDENAFALSCLVQWMCRSRIRNGEPISIYIPSTRMRKLLTSWMECGTPPSTSNP